MIKNTQQNGSRGSIPQHNKDHIRKTYSQHHTKSVPTEIMNKTRMSAFTTSIQHSIGSPSHSNQTRRRNKRYPNWKGRSKTVIVSDDMIVCTENPIDSTKKTTIPNK